MIVTADPRAALGVVTRVAMEGAAAAPGVADLVLGTADRSCAAAGARATVTAPSACGAGIPAAEAIHTGPVDAVAVATTLTAGATAAVLRTAVIIPITGAVAAWNTGDTGATGFVADP